MTRLTVEQDMKLGSALDQLEDAIEAAYASLKMVEWAQLNVARYIGGTVAPELNAAIRSTPVDVDKLWALVRSKRKDSSEERKEILAFIEEHNCKLLDIIIDHRD